MRIIVGTVHSGKLVPPPPQREILDPPLLIVQRKSQFYSYHNKHIRVLIFIVLPSVK